MTVHAALIAALAVLFALFSAFGASQKNRCAACWFFSGLLFGPFGLLVYALPVMPGRHGAGSSFAWVLIGIGAVFAFLVGIGIAVQW